MLLKILQITLTIDIINAKSLNTLSLIVSTVYIRFIWSKGYSYILDDVGSFNNIYIYLSILSRIVIKSISIGIAKKTFLR